MHRLALHRLARGRIDHRRRGRAVRVVHALCLCCSLLRLLRCVRLLLHCALVGHRHAAGVVVVDAVLGDLEGQRVEHAILFGQRQVLVVLEAHRDQLVVQVGRDAGTLVQQAALDAHGRTAEAAVSLCGERRDAEDLHADGLAAPIHHERVLRIVARVTLLHARAHRIGGHHEDQFPVAQAHHSGVVGLTRQHVLGHVAAVDRFVGGDRLALERAAQARHGGGAGVGISHHQERHFFLQREHVVVATGQGQRHQQRCGSHPPRAPLAAACHVGHGNLIADRLGDRLLDLLAVACILLAEHGFFRTAETSMGATPLRQARGRHVRWFPG